MFYSLCYDPRDTLVFIGTSESTILVYSLTDDAQSIMLTIQLNKTDRKPITAMCFIPVLRTLLCTLDQKFLFLSIESKGALKTAENLPDSIIHARGEIPHSCAVRSIQFISTLPKRHLGAKHETKTDSLSPKHETKTDSLSPKQATAAAAAADTGYVVSFIVTAGDKGTIDLWQQPNPAPPIVVKPLPKSKRGQQALADRKLNRIATWKVDTERAITSCQWSPRDGCLYVATTGPQICALDLSKFIPAISTIPDVEEPPKKEDIKNNQQKNNKVTKQAPQNQEEDEEHEEHEEDEEHEEEGI